MPKLYTRNDAAAEKANWNARFNAKAEKRAAEIKRIEGILAANPQIGMVTRVNSLGFAFYVYDPDYREANDPADLI